ncbi:hypothetical protein BESB_030650 [Besnoitia besnoiti]|uniref:Uncharacterized protein n=1 Tax=Besnoitia besnoiti TaxID=94643 RepID=A0A2A9M4F8_BESBE|nr:hypothetical protein BESB_030650 [Besnoitia besnoiti]PFH31191.1 hypothetical protein BESB_030650 [Besnoitia besnoiti]
MKNGDGAGLVCRRRRQEPPSSVEHINVYITRKFFASAEVSRLLFGAL